MQYSWDSYVCSSAEMEDLDEKSVSDFINKVNNVARFSLPNDKLKALNKIRLIKDGKPTNAAMILFSKRDMHFNVHIGRFKTKSLIIADKII